MVTQEQKVVWRIHAGAILAIVPAFMSVFFAVASLPLAISLRGIAWLYLLTILFDVFVHSYLAFLIIKRKLYAPILLVAYMGCKLPFFYDASLPILSLHYIPCIAGAFVGYFGIRGSNTAREIEDIVERD